MNQEIKNPCVEETYGLLAKAMQGLPTLPDWGAMWIIDQCQHHFPPQEICDQMLSYLDWVSFEEVVKDRISQPISNEEWKLIRAIWKKYRPDIARVLEEVDNQLLVRRSSSPDNSPSP